MPGHLARLVGLRNGKPLYAPLCPHGGRQIGLRNSKQLLFPPGCSTTTHKTLARMVGLRNGKPLYSADECCAAGPNPGSSGSSGSGSGSGTPMVSAPCGCTGTVPTTLHATLSGATGVCACINGTYTIAYSTGTITPAAGCVGTWTSVFNADGNVGWSGLLAVCNCGAANKLGIFFYTIAGACRATVLCNCAGATSVSSPNTVCSPFSFSGTIAFDPLGLWENAGCTCTCTSSGGSQSATLTITP